MGEFVRSELKSPPAKIPRKPALLLGRRAVRTLSARPSGRAAPLVRLPTSGVLYTNVRWSRCGVRVLSARSSGGGSGGKSVRKRERAAMRWPGRGERGEPASNAGERPYWLGLAVFVLRWQGASAARVLNSPSGSSSARYAPVDIGLAGKRVPWPAQVSYAVVIVVRSFAQAPLPPWAPAGLDLRRSAVRRSSSFRPRPPRSHGPPVRLTAGYHSRTRDTVSLRLLHH